MISRYKGNQPMTTYGEYKVCVRCTQEGHLSKDCKQPNPRLPMFTKLVSSPPKPKDKQ